MPLSLTSTRINAVRPAFSPPIAPPATGPCWMKRRRTLWQRRTDRQGPFGPTRSTECGGKAAGPANRGVTVQDDGAGLDQLQGSLAELRRTGCRAGADQQGRAELMVDGEKADRRL